MDYLHADHVCPKHSSTSASTFTHKCCISTAPQDCLLDHITMMTMPAISWPQGYKFREPQPTTATAVVESATGPGHKEEFVLDTWMPAL
jgi:hypothetical protein